MVLLKADRRSPTKGPMTSLMYTYYNYQRKKLQTCGFPVLSFQFDHLDLVLMKSGMQLLLDVFLPPSANLMKICMSHGI